MKDREVLAKAIEDLKIDLSEQRECGDSEATLATAQKLADYQSLFARSVPIKWWKCGLCRGYGKHTEFEESWECPACRGDGGHFGAA